MIRNQSRNRGSKSSKTSSNDQLYVYRISTIVGKKWLSDQDLNLDKVNQNHLCCHYTIGQNMHL